MRLTRAFRAVLLAALILPANLLIAADPPHPYIVPTDPLSPREERAALHVPPGFRVQLFASEPDIQKPINMAFDAAGRLWVTGSTEYPFAAPADRPGRDSIKILEDRDGDGRADRVTTFATGLNIPIGIYPYGQGAVVFSIPNIYDLKDTDGDGQADTRTVLYGPFDCGHDTHGLQNAFRRRLDGSIHACHGFANQSVVSGRDGHTIRMNSGNTYRFRIDGQRIEHFTWGQVNPFGLTMDRWGDWYTSDCHSKPQAMLLRGGYYPSFGAPHDGLGFVPSLMQHSHGSTAIDGAVCYSADQFPAEYYENLFCGNVVTSRVNRDLLVRRGSSLHAEARDDFLISDDGWFRPVDLQVGPDGALYIADFYNRIIGHYEVPLDHPGRDRHRGRIWRVTYTGAVAKDAGAKDAERPSAGDLSQASVDELLEALADPNLGVRMRATDQLSDRVGLAAVEPTERAIRESRSPTVRVHGLWVLHRLNRLSAAAIQRAAGDREELVRVHAMRLLAERADWTTPLRQVALTGLSDRAVRVRRVAAEAVGLHADRSHIGPLVALIRAEEKEDSPLKHAARIALRNQFRDAAPIDQVWGNGLTFPDARVIADVAVGLPSEVSATFLLDFMQRFPESSDAWSRYLMHAARHLPLAQIDRLAELTQRVVDRDIDREVRLFRVLGQAIDRRGATVSPGVRRWAEQLVDQLFTSSDSSLLNWGSVPYGPMASETNPWGLARRMAALSRREITVVSSLPGGEASTGILRTATFPIPPRLDMAVAGHLGPPDRPPVASNRVRLCLAETGATVAETLAPRNDVAQSVRWDLSAWQGQRGYLEIVDGLDQPGYAWIAVGEFAPQVVPMPAISPRLATERQVAAAEICARVGMDTWGPRLTERLLRNPPDAGTQAAVAAALAKFRSDSRLAALAGTLPVPELSSSLRESICQTIAEPSVEAIDRSLADVMRLSSAAVQMKLAMALAGEQEGATRLLTLVGAGQAPARLLQDETLRQKLLANRPPAFVDQLDALVADLPPRDARISQLIRDRYRRFAEASPSIEHGAALFVRHCRVCHRIGSEGAVVGPQLDGIGARGLQRLLEDVLDPNRNVDQAFWTTTYLLDDGRVVTGLPRATATTTITVIDREGKERIVPKEAIEETRTSNLSLMPENWGDAIVDADLFDLMAYLLAERTAPTKR